jgi:uncharacterized protein YbbK (DUF523 family)
MYIISACLVGENCKYDGGNNYNESVCQFTKEHNCIMICPEMDGGLGAPRPPAEQVGDRVINQEGEDVTRAFRRGAEKSLEKSLAEAERLGEPVEGAILRANSPTCGCGTIYDGTFSGILTEGDGIFARLLKERGIPVEVRSAD